MHAGQAPYLQGFMHAGKTLYVQGFMHAGKTVCLQGFMHAGQGLYQLCCFLSLKFVLQRDK